MAGSTGILAFTSPGALTQMLMQDDEWRQHEVLPTVQHHVYTDLLPLIHRDEPLEFDMDDAAFYSDQDTEGAQDTANFVTAMLPELKSYGTEHCQWVAFLNEFKSAKKYEARVNHFLAFHMVQTGSNGNSMEELQSSLLRYHHIHTRIFSISTFFY